MRKLFWLMALPLLWPACLQAQHSISGRVTDKEQGITLPGAHVRLVGTHLGGFADSNGTYVFNQLPSGTYTLETSFLGYETRLVSIDLNQNSQLDISLERKTVLTDEVVVMANRANSRMGATFSNLSKEELSVRNLGQDVPVLLSITPSVVYSSDAGTGIGYTWMSVRGSDQSRINVTINGIPVNDAESHGVWWVNMPDLVSSVDNLQIQRGVGLSTHGAGAFGATISLLSNALRPETYAEVSSSAGSFNSLKNTVSFGTGLVNSRWAFDGRLSNIRSDGYIDRATARLSSFYLSGGYYGASTMIKAIAFSGKEHTYQAWNGVPGDSLATNRRFNPSGMYYDDQGNRRFYENETDNYQQDHYQLHVSQSFGSGLTANMALHHTYGRGYYEQYRSNERFSRYGLPNVEIGGQVISRSDLIRQRWLDNRFTGMTYSLLWQPGLKVSTVLGGGYNVYDGDHFGEIIWARYAKHADMRHRYYDNNGLKKDLNTFLKVEYEPGGKLHLFADLQYRHISYRFMGNAWIQGAIAPLEQTVYFNFFNPKMGMQYRINPRLDVYLYSGIGNREPVRRDFTESSPESRPKHESMYNTEAGVKYGGRKLRFSANLYNMYYRDQLVLTGEINDVGGYTRTNIDRSYRSGIEMEASVLLAKGLSWSGNLTLSRNKIPLFVEHSDLYDNNWNWIGTDIREYHNTDIAFSPSVISSGILSCEPVENLFLSLVSRYVGKQFLDNTMSRDRMLDPYFVNDLRMNYTLKPGALRELELVFQVANLMNVSYITNAWIYKGVVGDMGLITIDDGYFPQAGRHFMAGINLRF